MRRLHPEAAPFPPTKIGPPALLSRRLELPAAFGNVACLFRNAATGEGARCEDSAELQGSSPLRERP